jgi:RNA recognition motif-containing protein
VGNLSFDSTKGDLEDFFAKFGSVKSVKIIFDRETGRSKGFGFVTFDNSASMQAAIELHGTELHGRTLNINEAKPRGGRRDWN